jgi:hypothetical protein
MTFADRDTLIVADWRAGQLHALPLPPASERPPAAFNLMDVSAPIARALHTGSENLRFEDLAFRPGTELAYISLSVIHEPDLPQPALVSVTAAGEVQVVDLANTPRTSAAIPDRPGPDKDLWRNVLEETLTVTCLLYYDHKVYVAGLSDSTFASTLRVYDFPFRAQRSASFVEMYHPMHEQLETRAPIRAMAVVDLQGEPYLLAAYAGTPLVTVPLRDLQDSTFVTARTIAELGWGSTPVDMLQFDAGHGQAILLVNSHRSADLIPVTSIAEANQRPGLSSVHGDTPSSDLRYTSVPMAGIAQLDNQDDAFFGALRRDPRSGAMQLVSIRKGTFARLSDFVTEYDFADFHYRHGDSLRDLHELLRADEGYPDLAKRAAR